MDSRIRDQEQLGELLDEMRLLSRVAQIGRLKKIRERLELDEMYYEQKGSDKGLARIRGCLVFVDDRLRELQGENEG